MKNTFKIFTVILVSLLLVQGTFAQKVFYIEPAATVDVNDSVVIRLNDYQGDIQWQKSIDLATRRRRHRHRRQFLPQRYHRQPGVDGREPARYPRCQWQQHNPLLLQQRCRQLQPLRRPLHLAYRNERCHQQQHQPQQCAGHLPHRLACAQRCEWTELVDYVVAQGYPNEQRRGKRCRQRLKILPAGIFPFGWRLRHIGAPALGFAQHPLWHR
jgi:hypothetical protein